jgi:hypothetical protein
VAVSVNHTEGEKQKESALQIGRDALLDWEEVDLEYIGRPHREARVGEGDVQSKWMRALMQRRVYRKNVTKIVRDLLAKCKMLRIVL